MSFDNIIFDNKKFSDILREIHKKCNDKNERIEGLIAGLKNYVTDVETAQIIVPLIKEYLEIDVKNDEHMVKMAAIIQRALMRFGGEEQKESGEVTLSEDEKKNFMIFVKGELDSLNNDIDENILGIK